MVRRYGTMVRRYGTMVRVMQDAGTVGTVSEVRVVQC